MYTTCLHCHADLGRNESLELFPVGRRLAFDQGKGRLWVVCTRCARWNLTPMDTRWEIIEACERRYRDAKKRVATDQVGLAKLEDGLSLVRIGKPLFPEYASWRYGERFQRRYRRNLIYTSAAVVGAGALYLAGNAYLGIGGLYAGWSLIQAAKGFARDRLRLASYGMTTTTAGKEIELKRGDLDDVAIVSTNYGPLKLGTGEPWTLRVARGRDPAYHYVVPSQAPELLRRLLPGINAQGQDERGVDLGVELYEQWSGRVIDNIVPLVQREVSAVDLSQEPALTLALEMSLNEEQERKWLESELYLLQASWEEAEKLAAIADDLTLPQWVGERMDKMRRGGDSPSSA